MRLFRTVALIGVGLLVRKAVRHKAVRSLASQRPAPRAAEADTGPDTRPMAYPMAGASDSGASPGSKRRAHH